MAFEVSLGTTSSEKRALDKSVSSVWSGSGTLKNDTNVVNPSILVQVAASSIAACNYMSIPDFGRKYFITDITAVAANLSMVSGHCDVLSTYKEDIRKNTAVISRSATEGNWNLLLTDNMMKVNNQMKTQILKGGFSSFPKNQSTIMLITTG